MDSIDAFEFDNEALWEEEIHDEVVVKRYAFIDQWNTRLWLNWTSPKPQFYFHTFLVN